VLGILSATIVLDHRVAFSEQLDEMFPGIVLAVLPPDTTAITSWRVASVASLVFIVSYSTLAITYSIFI
jgi:hypothetical protein